EDVDLLERERLGLDRLVLPDLRQRAERGGVVGVLGEEEEVPRPHDGEDLLERALLLLDVVLELIEVLGRLLEGLAALGGQGDKSCIREHGVTSLRRGSYARQGGGSSVNPRIWTAGSWHDS